MTAKANLLLLAAATAVCGCQSSSMLVFGQSQTVGITIGGAASDAGAEMTVGYKDRNVAIVPVALMPEKNATAKDAMLVTSTVGAEDGDKDALSVLGQFEVSAKAQDAQVGLGKFFATGLAAQKLADGFACKLADPRKCPGYVDPKTTQPPVTPTAAR